MTETTGGNKPLINMPRTWEKFTPSGEAKRHRGTTFVAQLVADSPLFRAAERIRADIRTEGLGSDFALLPSASFHMTVLEGLKDQSLLGQQGAWPAQFVAAGDLSDAAIAMRTVLADARIAGLSDVVMRPVGVYPLTEGLTIDLRPVNDRVAGELDRFRKEAGAALGIKVAELEDYRFHVTIGYRLTEVGELDSQHEQELVERYSGWVTSIRQADLEPVAFTVFNDMLSFPPLLYFR